MIRHADSNNKYIHILKTDVNKSNELSKLLKKKAEDWLDDIKNDWTFEIEGPEEHGEFGSVDGPNVDDEFGKFIDYIEEDTTLTYFFDTDISEVEMKQLCEFIYDEGVSQDAYDVIENTIEEEKEGFLEDYEPNPNNYPYGPGMSQRDFL